MFSPKSKDRKSWNDAKIVPVDEFLETLSDGKKNDIAICLAIKDAGCKEKILVFLLLVTFQGGRDVCLFPNCRDHLRYFKLVVAVTGELILYKSDSEKIGWLTWISLLLP